MINYVPAIPDKKPKNIVVPITGEIVSCETVAKVNLNNDTSARDRALGFLIMNVPLFGSFGIVVWALVSWSSGYVLLNFFGFLVLWGSFAGSWLLTYIVTALLSPEGIALYEAYQRYLILKTEQRNRWKIYEEKVKNREDE